MPTDTPTAERDVAHVLNVAAHTGLGVCEDDLKRASNELRRLRAELEQAREALKSIATMKPSEIAPDTVPGLVHGPALLLKNCQRVARAALSSSPGERAPTPSAPTGWKLMPIEPTDDMRRAAVRAPNSSFLTLDGAAAVYRAMLSASPSPEDAHDNNA